MCSCWTELSTSAFWSDVRHLVSMLAPRCVSLKLNNFTKLCFWPPAGTDEKDLFQRRKLCCLSKWTLNFFHTDFFFFLKPNHISKSLSCCPLHSTSPLHILNCKNLLVPQTLQMAKWTRLMLPLISTRNVFSYVWLLWFSLQCWLQIYSSVCLKVTTEIQLSSVGKMTTI